MSPADAKKAAAGGVAAILRVYMVEGLLEDFFEQMDVPLGDREDVQRAMVELGVELCGRAEVRACRSCGCTDAIGCIDGCSWVEENLCSACTGTPAGDESRILVVPR